MGRKGKRRREARRARRGRLTAGVEPGAAEREAPAPAEAREPVRPATVAPASRHKAAGKRRKRGGGLLGLRLSPWLLAVPVLAVGIGFVAVGVMRGGSSGMTGGEGEPTPDPRVAGLPIDASFNIEAGDDGTGGNAYFRPNTISANAGDVIELVITNVGSVIHNLRVSGLDKEYETDDDFESPPNTIKPGETGRVVVKIDPPDTYPFRCDFHPILQVGTLVLQ